MDWFMHHAVLLALVCAAVAVGYGLYLTWWLLKQPDGNERMREIAGAVQEGASAYLRRQYTTIALVAIVPFILIGVYNKLGWGTAFGFHVGALLSAAAGFIGMNVAVRSNSRTAEAARNGGGIYTKAADVGADLVGKIEAGIPEDDPRNAAVIADNVGDNVGDCAGMAADLFETYAVTAVAVMLLGTAAGLADNRLYLYPLVLGAVSAVASVIGTFFARIGRGENAIINALYKAVIVATVLSAIGFIPVTIAFDKGQYDFTHLYLSAIVGLIVTFLLVAITEFYTGTRWPPVKSISKASQTGHATNIIEGLAVGMQATAAPVIVIATGVLVAHHLAGLYGIGVDAMAQLSLTGR